MSDEKTVERRVLTERLEVVRKELRETGATVLSPTPEWSALRREMLELNKKLK